MDTNIKIWLHLVFLWFGLCSHLMILGCRETNDIGSPVVLTDGDEEGCEADCIAGVSFFQLPMDEVCIVFGVGSQGEVNHAEGMPRELSRDLIVVGDSLAHANGISSDGEDPFGHFLINQNNQVLGFSFLPASPIDYKPAGRGVFVVDGAPFTWSSPMVKFFDGHGAMESPEAIKSLGNLKRMNAVEFIDFGMVSFKKGVWADLAKMSSCGYLRGISVFRGENFLSVRDDLVVPEIRGLSAHVDDMSKIGEFGKAFPNLTFLCLSVADRHKINELFSSGILLKYFPNLRGLMIGDVYWSQSEFIENGDENRDVSGALRIYPKQIPDHLQWLCIDGSLLSMGDMVQYNSLGVSLRYNGGARKIKKIPERDIDVVFAGYGYSTGGSRSLGGGEYAELEKLWRKQEEGQ